MEKTPAYLTVDELRRVAAQSGSNVVLVYFANRALPDLRDVDSVHRNVATGRLADAFTQLAGLGRDDDAPDVLPAGGSST